MEVGFLREYLPEILIGLSIPLYFLFYYLVAKFRIKNKRARVFLTLIFTFVVLMAIGFVIVIRGFILYHDIPGISQS